jgi:hypothetical protein
LRAISIFWKGACFFLGGCLADFHTTVLVVFRDGWNDSFYTLAITLIK